MFKDISDHIDDPIEATFVRLAADTHPGKIDLGIGVYRDESGQVPVMHTVREAEKRLIARSLPKSYLSPLGNLDYCREVYGESYDDWGYGGKQPFAYIESRAMFAIRIQLDEESS